MWTNAGLFNPLQISDRGVFFPAQVFVQFSVAWDVDFISAAIQVVRCEPHDNVAQLSKLIAIARWFPRWESLQ